MKIFCYEERKNEVIEHIGKVLISDGDFIEVEFYGFRKNITDKYQSERIIATFKKMKNNHYFNGMLGEAIAC